MATLDNNSPDRTPGETSRSNPASLIHELINDLAAISTYVSLLTHELTSDAPSVTAQFREDIGQVGVAAERARALGLQLADWLRATENQPDT